MLNELAKAVHEIACSKGWHDTPVPFGVALSNIHGEVSEAWEDFRNNRPLTEIYYEGNKPCGIPTELADIIIRVLDTCAANGIDISEAVCIKMAYNKTRSYRHGGKQA